MGKSNNRGQHWMGSSSIEFVSKRFGLSFLSRPDVSDFWREIGAFTYDIPENIYFASDGFNLAVYEVFESAVGIHIAIPPINRGKSGIEFGIKSIEFAKKHINDNVLARIAIDRREVLLYARMCGMVEYSSNDTHKFLRA